MEIQGTGDLGGVECIVGVWKGIIFTLSPSLSLCVRYKAIVKYKTAFYSFYLPVAAAMYMVSV